MNPWLRALAVIFLELCIPSVRAATADVAAPWVPDLGNGTYKNPVLYADYSDPDVLRNGDDFWLVSSSFSHVPGLPILHSRDLVNWELVNYALPKLVPADFFSSHRPGQGVWAPSLRRHGGKFYIYYPDPDYGIYCITTQDPAGTWSEPKLVLPGKGLIDPCPLWDDDGKCYLVHTWAKSRAGIGNLLTLNTLSPDGQQALDDGRIIIDANQLPGWTTLEGPKLYKRNGYYYIFAPAGGVAGGYQAVFRARNIYGPYKNRVVLAQGGTAINGPHQGAWVDTPAGENWFLHFQDLGPYGRVVHLEPMTWLTNDWPAMGQSIDAHGTGEPVLVHAKPRGMAQPVAVPRMSDDFNETELGRQWQWQANPLETWKSLTARPGWLRLYTQRRPAPGSLYLAPSLLLQKFPAPVFDVLTRLDFSAAEDGDAAGLLVFGYDYAWVGLRQVDGKKQLVVGVNRSAQDRHAEVYSEPILASAPALYLRVQVLNGANCRFAYSWDGKAFTSIGGSFTATVSRWVGAKVGLFALGEQAHQKATAADFDWFRVSAPGK